MPATREIVKAHGSRLAGDEPNPPGVAVADGNQLGGRMISIDAGMAAAEETEPDDPDLQSFVHLVNPGMVQPRKSSMNAESSATTASKKLAPISGSASDGS